MHTYFHPYLELCQSQSQVAAKSNDEKVIFKNCASFTHCIRQMNNTQIDNARDIDVVMPMYNLIRIQC